MGWIVQPQPLITFASDDNVGIYRAMPQERCYAFFINEEPKGFVKLPHEITNLGWLKAVAEEFNQVCFLYRITEIDLEGITEPEAESLAIIGELEFFDGADEFAEYIKQFRRAAAVEYLHMKQQRKI